METITTIGFIALVIFMVFMTIRIIINTVRNERNRKAYSKVIKTGDKVSVPVFERYSGEVLEVNGDEVTIVVTAHKNRVYLDK